MLTVLKGFTEGGKRYAPGEPAPKGLHARTVELLIRTRHLHDAVAKRAPRVRNELLTVVNEREDWVLAPNVDGSRYVRSVPTVRLGSPATPGSEARLPTDPLAGQALAKSQDWNAPIRTDQRQGAIPGQVMVDAQPEDPLAGRKLASQQDWTAGPMPAQKG